MLPKCNNDGSLSLKHSWWECTTYLCNLKQLGTEAKFEVIQAQQNALRAAKQHIPKWGRCERSKPLLDMCFERNDGTHSTDYQWQAYRTETFWPEAADGLQMRCLVSDGQRRVRFRVAYVWWPK